MSERMGDRLSRGVAGATCTVLMPAPRAGPGGTRKADRPACRCAGNPRRATRPAAPAAGRLEAPPPGPPAGSTGAQAGPGQLVERAVPAPGYDSGAVMSSFRFSSNIFGLTSPDEFVAVCRRAENYGYDTMFAAD